MKKILGLVLGLMVSAFTFAQTAVTFTDVDNGYDKATASEFHFNLDETITNESIMANAAYYTDYFTLVATPATVGHDVTFTLAVDDEMSRKVIHRYFVSLQVATINVSGAEVPVKEFMETYIIK